MILSALKILLFFAVVLALALGAEHLAMQGEPVRFIVSGVEYTLGPVQAVVTGIVLLIAAWLFWKIVGLIVAVLRFLMGDETAIDRWFRRSRERKGYKALGEGMLALAAGEGQAALDQATKAAKFLKRPQMTDLLTAQAAELAGERATAHAAYQRMLADRATRFIAIRGLMHERLDLGDTATALKLAEKAYAIKPRNSGHQDQLLALQTQAHDWHGARGVLRDKRRQGQMPKDLHTRRDAVLALQEARDALARGESVDARETAISANRAAPGLVPAAVLAAESHCLRKDPRSAAKALEKAWKLNPHPALAAAYAAIAPDETPQQRLRRFEPLLRQAPDDPETAMLRAELLLAAEDFPGARRALGKLAETDPTVRSLSIMAAIERGSGSDDSIVRGWLARAMTASRGPQWVCDKCHNVMEDWAPVCDSCGAFDTLTWRRPDRHLRVAAMAAVEMLPLLVGHRTEGTATEVAGAAPPAAGDHEPVTPPGRHAPDDASLRPDAPPATAAGNAPAAGMTDDHPPPGQPVEEDAPREIAAVPPGIVPRESDFIVMPPSHTITRIDGGEPRRNEAPGDGPPVRPDVEPPEDANDAPPRPPVAES